MKTSIVETSLLNSFAVILKLVLVDFEKDRSINGIQAAREIWKANPLASIIVISNYDAQAYVKQLYECAPDDAVYGYILKDDVVRDLRTAVDSVLNKKVHIDPKLSSTLAKLNLSASPCKSKKRRTNVVSR